MVARNIIAETEHISAIEQDFGTDTVFITFNGMGVIRNGDRFWGDDFFLKLEISSIGIVTSSPNWLPKGEMDEIIPVILDKVGNRSVVTYGSSQGGYGALKYSKRLGARIALSFCPQYSIDPEVVGYFDQRFIRYHDKSLNNGSKIERHEISNNAFVFFDKSMEVDARNVELLELGGGIQKVLVPFSGHDSIRVITEGRIGEKLINACLAPAKTPTQGDLRQLIREARRDSRTYLIHKKNRLIPRATRSRLFLRKLLERFPNKENQFILGIVAYLDGNTTLALEKIDNIGEANARKINLQYIWILCNKLGFIEGEERVSNLILSIKESKTSLRFQSVDTFIRLNQLEKAGNILQDLVNRSDSPEFVDRFGEFSLKLGRTDILERLLMHPLIAPARTKVMFHLLECYQKNGDRANLFKTLGSLLEEPQKSTAELIRLSQKLAQINEWSFALDIRRALLKEDPDNKMLELDVIEALGHGSKTSREDAFQRLNSLRDSPQKDFIFWDRASYIYARMDKFAEAAKAIKKAIAYRSDDLGYRRRLAFALVRSGQAAEARAELEKILNNFKPDRRVFPSLGDIAAANADPGLALRFAEAQYETNKADPENILYLARRRRLAGERDRALSLLTGLLVSEREAPTISNAQWIELAQELYEVGGAVLAREATAEVLARDPRNAIARKIEASLSFAESHRVQPPTARLHKIEPTGGTRRASKTWWSRLLFWRRPV